MGPLLPQPLKQASGHSQKAQEPLITTGSKLMPLFHPGPWCSFVTIHQMRSFRGVQRQITPRVSALVKLSIYGNHSSFPIIIIPVTLRVYEFWLRGEKNGFFYRQGFYRCLLWIDGTFLIFYLTAPSHINSANTHILRPYVCIGFILLFLSLHPRLYLLWVIKCK